MLMNSKIIKQQLDRLIQILIECGLSSDQQFPILKSQINGLIEVTFPGSELLSLSIKNRSYIDIYAELSIERVYCVKMIDGALLQLSYLFKKDNLLSHRLAFFPSPNLEQFQNNPEIYLEDEIYADIYAKNIVPFPIRFDYDASDEKHREIEHPKSHLTLGQYKNCRIPVSSPLMPYQFIDFILRNFYNTVHRKYSKKLIGFTGSFDECILDAEKNVIYIQIPTNC